MSKLREGLFVASLKIEGEAKELALTEKEWWRGN
jgi:hypothetical protein